MENKNVTNTHIEESKTKSKCAFADRLAELIEAIAVAEARAETTAEWKQKKRQEKVKSWTEKWFADGKVQNQIVNYTNAKWNGMKNWLTS